MEKHHKQEEKRGEKRLEIFRQIDVKKTRNKIEKEEVSTLKMRVGKGKI